MRAVVGVYIHDEGDEEDCQKAGGALGGGQQDLTEH